MPPDTAELIRLKDIAVQVLQENGFRAVFSDAALDQVQVMLSEPPVVPDARDLRHLLWCSIDNDDSKDLDQLSVAEALNDGITKVLIAIADVGSRVARGSPADEHASTNTTSLYTAAGVFPMLPARISTDLTSLIQGQERLAVVVEIVVQKDGVVSAVSLYRARVLNRARLTYAAVAAWLDGTAAAPAPLSAVPGMEEQLRLQDRVAQCLRHQRYRRGALRLETIKARPTFTGAMLSDLRAEHKNRAQELIEDLMIATNAASARFLKQSGFPSIRRVLKAPARWDRIIAVAKERGAELPATPDAGALDAFLQDQRAKYPADFADLSLSVVKLLGSGEYVLESSEPDETVSRHFGLAVDDYMHSTAPNRRFPDLITQRLIHAALTGGVSPYSEDELAALAAHCTEREKRASKVERQVNKSAAAVLLASRVGEQFPAIVTGAATKGTWARIERPFAEGRIVQGFEGLDVGDRIVVRLQSVDRVRGFIDFEYVSDRA